MVIKLNLGSGDFELDGYINLDRKNGNEVYPLVAYADNSVDEIRASHILEHFGRREMFNVLQNWVSKLTIGGVLKIAVPDFEAIAKKYIKGDEPDFDCAGYVCGGQLDEDDFHKAIFDENKLRKSFELLGLTDIQRWESEVSDCASYPISLNLQGTKTESDLTYGEIGFSDDAYKSLLEKLSLKRHNVYSQGGEDGIVEAIFDKIGAQNKWCLEVGASDGIMFSNTRKLIEQGWNAILIEKDKDLYEKLVKNCEKYQNVKTFNLEISAGISLDSILKQCGAPKEIDLLCIDVDGQDWHIWNQLIEYQPRVVVIEYQPNCEDPDFIPSVGGSEQAGKAAIQKLAASKLYHNTLVTRYNVIAIRNDIKAVEKADIKKTKIFAVMSMPRLAFTDNMFSALKALVPLGIDLEKGSGVFWGQVLTRLFEEHLDDGTEYLLSIDYDTYFTKNQVIRLLQLMVEYPEADAIIPLQIKRECDFPLIGRNTEDRKSITQIPAYEFEKELMPLSVGHFGLSIFRVSSLKKLKKPWFIPKPDKNDSWHDGRIDEDIYFWHNFTKSGLQLFLAPKIGLAHLQLVATIPGKIQDGFKPQHRYLTDLDKNGMPDWCEPKVVMLKDEK